MKITRSVSILALSLVSSTVLAAVPSPGTTIAPPRSADVPETLTLIKTTPADVQRALEVQKIPAIPNAFTGVRNEAPPIVVKPPPGTIDPNAPVIGRLNVNQFGQKVHNALKDNVRGYAFGLRKNGVPIYTLNWGYARSPEEGGRVWNLDTRMHVASVSKLMTAIGTVKLLDEHDVSLDSRIAAYYPFYWSVGPNAKHITFRQLLTHRAGFVNTGGDYFSFKQQIEDGVPAQPSRAYTNGAFSILRVLNATMTGAVSKHSMFETPYPIIFPADQYNDILWDVKATDAFRSYMQAKVFTPSRVYGVSAEPTSTSALAYSGKDDKKGWDSGNLSTQLGGAGFRLSVNEVLDVMHTFRRKGTIVSTSKAKDAIEDMLGLDQPISTTAGTTYNKNGAWRNGPETTPDTTDIEQCVAYFLPENMELVVFVNSWIGPGTTSLRGLVNDAYQTSLQ